MSRATLLAIATAALAIMAAIYLPSDLAELELAAEQHAEARRLQIEQAAEDERAELVRKHKGQQ